MATLFNIENHPFIDEFFKYFDKNDDGLIDYAEMVRSLDIIEKGDFNEKVKFCFNMYDMFNSQRLDIITLREVLKKSYIVPIVKLESQIKQI